MKGPFVLYSEGCVEPCSPRPTVKKALFGSENFVNHLIDTHYFGIEDRYSKQLTGHDSPILNISVYTPNFIDIILPGNEALGPHN